MFYQDEIKHRKQQTFAEAYTFAEETAGNPSGQIVPYDQ